MGNFFGISSKCWQTKKLLIQQFGPLPSVSELRSYSKGQTKIKKSRYSENCSQIRPVVPEIWRFSLSKYTVRKGVLQRQIAFHVPPPVVCKFFGISSKFPETKKLLIQQFGPLPSVSELRSYSKGQTKIKKSRYSENCSQIRPVVPEIWRFSLSKYTVRKGVLQRQIAFHVPPPLV